MLKDRIRLVHINLARGYRGGERQTQLLVEGLANEGWPQRLIARRGEPLAERCVSVSGLETVEVAGHTIAGALALGRCDLVHVHEGRATQAAYLNSVVRGTPYIVTRRVQKGPSSSGSNRRMYGRAEAIVAVSSAIGASISALDEALVWSVIPDASSGFKSDPSRVAALRAQFGGEFVVGHIGELDDSHKGQLQVIALAAQLERVDPGVRFILVGGGRDEGMLRSAASGLSNIHFVGHVENVGDYLAAFDVFIHPSRHEGLGSILLDAMDFGLPIVGTAVGGIPEVIVDGENGFLCAPDDIDAMAEAVLRFRRDPDLRQQVEVVNRNKAGEFTPARMTSRYIGIYTELVAAQSRKQGMT